MIFKSCKGQKLLWSFRSNTLSVAEQGKKGPCAMTYQDLFNVLKEMAPEQLAQPAQVLPPGSTEENKPARLLPLLALDTVEHLLHVDGIPATEVRCVQDFTHRPEQLVLLVDVSPYSEEGDTFYTLEEGGMRGNKTGKLWPYDEKEEK